MAFAHVPLEEETLGPDVWKFVRPDAPAPAQTMVARGLAPLAPRDLLVALYQFWVTPDSGQADQAAKTLESLPPNVIRGALDDRNLPAGVLDFIGRKHPRSVEVLERVVSHAMVDDETLAGVSRLCPESICDVLAENQARWLTAPRIVESLYQNPNCRMSVAQRMIELAVRQGLDLKLPNIEELKQQLGIGDDQEVDDEGFKRAAGRVLASHDQVVDQIRHAGADDEFDPTTMVESTPAEAGDELDAIEALLGQEGADDMSLPFGNEADQEHEAKEAPAEDTKGVDRVTLISRLRPMEKIRMALLGNAFERAVLIRDSNKAVSLSAIKSPRIKENEVVAYAANRSLSHDIVRYISRRRDWTKLYAVKLNLVLNPKTPMAVAMSLLGHLHQHDVRKVAHSKNIPHALATVAKRKLHQRR